MKMVVLFVCVFLFSCCKSHSQQGNQAFEKKVVAEQEGVPLLKGNPRKKVVVINGKTVYSDKALLSIQGGLVTFKDGSWCNVSTGEVVDKGEGYIDIDNSSEKKSQPKKLKKSFSGISNLEIKDIPGDINIDVWNQSEVEVDAEIEAGELDFDEENGTLFISASGAQSRGSQLITIQGNGVAISDSHLSSVNILQTDDAEITRISVGGANISNVSGNIVVGNNVRITNGSGSRIKLTIKVPKGIDIKAEDFFANLTIGNTEGKLTISAENSAKVQVGKVKEVILGAEDNAEIKVSEAQNTANISAQDRGRITIESGTLQNLLISTEDQSRVNFMGTAGNSILSCSDQSSIIASNPGLSSKKEQDQCSIR